MWTDNTFLFVGYLIQVPYIVDPNNPAGVIATIDRPLHPSLQKIRYEIVDGIPNITHFLTKLPDMLDYPGYVLNGYGIEASKITPEVGLDTTTLFPSKYEYAKKFTRLNDNLKFLGYDIVDEEMHPFSFLRRDVFPRYELTEVCGPFNQYGLFADFKQAIICCEYILKTNQDEGTIWEVWG